MHNVASACNPKVFHSPQCYNKNMLLRKDRLDNIQILSLQTGASIAQVSTLIIDPRELKVIGFYCEGPRLDVHPAILLTTDIREISNLGLIVDSADVLMAPADLVRLHDVLAYRFQLEGKHVVDDTGRKMGKVANFTLDSESLYVVKLQVHPSVWQSLNTAELLIDRSQIIQVTDHEVLVKSSRTSEATQPAAVIENPFSNAPVKGASTSHVQRQP